VQPESTCHPHTITSILRKEDAAFVDPTDLEAKLLEREPTIAGPLHVVSSQKRSGATTYSISASRLVPVDDEDPSLRDICIPVPVTGEVEVDRAGGVTRVSVADVAAEAKREARAFVRTLIASGAVRGLAPTSSVRRGPGPPRRPTHEVRIDHAGRKVIRRSGFDITGTTRGG